ncbi:hypothetical protein, partial [Spirochaeta lutea]|uniref:hypothetical protein n=1 Tax=Spirochaeta lutea TaxID=1480694 RepID=UPI00138E07BD
ASTADLASVYTAGAQSVTGDTINLNGSTYQSTAATSPISFEGATVLTTDVDVTTANSDISFTTPGTIDGAFALDLTAGTGTVDVAGVVGTDLVTVANHLTNFTVSSASTADLDSVFTSGAQSVTAD